MAASEVRRHLGEGIVIPACPLALNSRRILDERHQRALFRYYLAAGAGGLAVGVHTTQFAIRHPKVNLLQPVLELAAEELRRFWSAGLRPGTSRNNPNAGSKTGAPKKIGIAGICGRTRQATTEAMLARDLGFDAGLVSLGALQSSSERELLSHCRHIAGILPIVGFYLQPAAGGRLLSHTFWRRFAEIAGVVAIKIAPFNRYQTLDVIRAVAESGRDDIALYTGNDDNIVMDLLTPFRFCAGGKPVERRIVGGLLGHWAVWTKRAVELHAECRRIADKGKAIPVELLHRAIEVTDCNAAFFDAANGYAGCIPGIHEVLRRQGLLKNIRCLDPHEKLSPGQRDEIDRVYQAYPNLNDDAFVEQHRDEWLRG